MQRPFRPKPHVEDLREKLNRMRRQEKSNQENDDFSKNLPPPDPAYNFLKDPLRGDDFGKPGRPGKNNFPHRHKEKEKIDPSNQIKNENVQNKPRDDFTKFGKPWTRQNTSHRKQKENAETVYLPIKNSEHFLCESKDDFGNNSRKLWLKRNISRRQLNENEEKSLPCRKGEHVQSNAGESYYRKPRRKINLLQRPQKEGEENSTPSQKSENFHNPFNKFEPQPRTQNFEMKRTPKEIPKEPQNKILNQPSFNIKVEVSGETDKRTCVLDETKIIDFSKTDEEPKATKKATRESQKYYLNRKAQESRSFRKNRPEKNEESTNDDVGKDVVKKRKNYRKGYKPARREYSGDTKKSEKSNNVKAEEDGVKLSLDKSPPSDANAEETTANSSKD